MTRTFAEIQRGQARTVAKLSDLFEVSQKTVHRDIEFLRDRMELPINWNAAKREYEVDEKARLPWWI